MISKSVLSFVRRVMALTGLSRTRLYIKYYRMRRGTENIAHLLEEKRAKRFEKIYETGVWLNERKTGSLSGLGSEIATTKNVREELPKALAHLDVKSLLDIGCGDWNWMSHVKLACPYIGVDIVAPVIERNIAAFGACDKTFIVLDAVEESVPDCDAVLVREVLFHLSFGDAQKLLSNVLKTQARYLITTTDSDVKRNLEIRTGDFRELNLRIKPFLFPAPIMEIPDDSVSQARRMGVWQLSDLRLKSGMK